ncbi:hypothetical protein B0A48_06931 [Cryoendolithus antarcticus]|uniref:Uncharacterized protein n=1 Tax=Cryoendolithus antarcticus TaxID=1507870 RepID=A0A1V8T9Q4_9PEZI|nr:hypothetical protein B0A48_06931 [Cryoendolithus antarcticus]
MPYTDPVSSVSGRNSRASNVSAATGASRSHRPPPMGSVGDTLANAGVLSMLKTSTDTGDIGALSFNSSRLPRMPHRAGQSRQHPSRLSSSSRHPPGGPGNHNYAPSVQSRVSSNNREWDTASNGRRGSMTSMQTMPTFISDAQTSIMSGNRPLGLGPLPGYSQRDSRSHSLTNDSARQLPPLRSATSLKSQGHEPRQRYEGPPPPMPEIRGPFVYPTRLKRPGYRSPSPALSDNYPHGQSVHPAHVHHRRQPMPAGPAMPNLPPMARPPLQTYNSDYGPDYPVDHGYLHPPPPRGMSVSPVNYEQPAPLPAHYHYRQPAMPPAHAHPMHQHGQRGMPALPPHSIYGPPRPMFAQPQYGMPQHPRRGPAPPPHVAPMAVNMFHNAARMARQVPQRTDTPMHDLSPPSSDPPSSGTAPSASSPPTPRDTSTVQVVIDPAFIDPALTDLPESTSDPVMPTKYFEYADGLERVEDSEIEVHHPSVPPSGFVQRVRAMLESRAAAEAAARRDADREHERIHAERMQIESYDFANANATRFTVIEEYQSPVELPASPIKLAELSAGPKSPVQSLRRLTRDLVKAELAPSTTEVQGSSRLDPVTPSKGQPWPARPCERTPGYDTTTFEPSQVEEGTQQTDLPSSPPMIQHKGSVTESVGTCGTDAQSKASGMDSALHYSPPPETEGTATDLGETETESRDPFALQADTMTAQRQEARAALRSIHTDMPPEPVSPMLTGENVNRFSAVSPIHIETLGIDATIQQANDKDSPPSKNGLRPAADENLPPTPRTPRTYSKSVQLAEPNVSLTETNSNRLSLPADLSMIGDTTINSATDAMTDMAVRFSMPGTTITIGKPQIINISASSTPLKDEASTLKPALYTTDRPRCGGTVVTFEDEVAPLKVQKKAEQHRQSQSLGAIVPIARSNGLHTAPSFDEQQVDPDRSSRDTTADIRFSGIHFIRNKYPSTHLPGLKEESLEDMSIHDHHRRSTDIAAGLRFQLPARIAAVKAMQERSQQEAEEKRKSRDRSSRAPEPGRPLGEIRDLPSLNFSRMDLIDKLNDALQVHPTKSLEVARRRDFSGICCPNPYRPVSGENLWDRYASFFNKPEDFPAEIEDEEGSEKGEDFEAEAEKEGVESKRGSKALSDDDAAGRPLSPQEHMLQVATQVNRLSIPSVNGLSERLSELLPSLRNLHLDSVLANDREVAHTIDDIHQLGHIPGPRPDTVLSTRTSAGFRTLAERAEEIVLNGTHDSIIPGRALALNKELPALPGSMSTDPVASPLSLNSKASYLSGSISAPSGLAKVLERPASAMVRTRTPLTEDEVQKLLPPEMNPIAKGSRRSLLVSSLSSRPWNLDENYPWSEGSLAIDLTAPDKVHHRETLASELARHRSTKSLDVTRTGNNLLDSTNSGIDVGSIITDLDPSASINTEQLTGVSTTHAHKNSKRSIFGSLKHKIGLARSTIDDTTKTVSTPTATRTTDEPTTHNPGDRYPTTALTAPLGFNLDEVRSYFSDDSAESHRGKNSHRKTPKGRRWTGLKSRNKQHHHPAPGDPQRSQSLNAANSNDVTLQTQSYSAGSSNEHRLLGLGESSGVYAFEGVGMGKTEFRIKRFGEKLRVLFAKGGELIRSLSVRSQRKKGPGGRDEWLEDSLYSGV